MSLIEWKKEFCTGISGVDYEHEELIGSINSFFESVDSRSDKEALVAALDAIYGEIYSHFVLEERLMKKYGYDEYEAHRNDHGRLLDEIREMTVAFENSPGEAEQQLKQALSDWFGVHFKTHDARLHKLEELVASGKAKGNVITGFFRNR